MLTARQRLLASAISAFGGADLHSFDDRLLLQKRVYLLGASGVDLGYMHSWYLRGPYCPALTRDAFACDHEFRTVGFGVGTPLPKIVSEKITGLRAALGSYWSDPSRLELLASVVFLNRTAPEKTPLELMDTLLDKKPKYKSQEVSKAVKIAGENGWLQ